MAKNTERPMSAKEQRFIHYYVQTRDVERAAGLSGFNTNFGMKLYKRADIREEIDRRITVVELEQAKLAAQDVVLTENLLDRELLQIIQLDPREFAREKLKALQFGYVLQGKVQIGTTVAVGKADPNATPAHQNFYQAFSQTTTTHALVSNVAPSAMLGPQAPVTIDPPPPLSEEPPAQKSAVWKY